MADKSENFIYVPLAIILVNEEEDGETLSSTEEMSDDSDVEMTDSFIVDDDDEDYDGIPKASVNYKDSDDSYELSDDDSSSS